MKNIITVVCLCVALLPSYILGYDWLKRVLDEIAENNRIINKIFQPSKDGYLGQGFSGITYKGTLLLPINKTVAMKFTDAAYENNGCREYGAYTYLNAINCTDVEAYGIPSVGYFGFWGNYTLLAITLLDSNFEERVATHQLTETDILIVCREFVRISKYIHGHGIYHNDFHLRDLMFRNNRGFIIDYNWAKVVYNITNTKKDWACFMKELTIATEKNNIRSTKLDRVFVKFSKSIAIDAPEKLNYDELYKYINEIIGHNGTVFLSWLTDQQRQMATNESAQNPIPTIGSIKRPARSVAFNLPKIKFDYFVGYNQGMKSPSVFQAGIESGVGKGLNSDPYHNHEDSMDLDLHL